jgi:ABC-type nitrate/sulfonate/bicarbonate transport system substrate-binding protein
MPPRIYYALEISALCTLALLMACQAPLPTPTSAPAAGAPATQAPAAAQATSVATVAATVKPVVLQKVTISYSTITAFQALLWVTKDKGLFEKYGLDANFNQIATVQQISAVTAGQVDIGQTTCDTPASAILNGADLKLFAMFVPYVEALLYGRPEIKTAADLKGKVLGVSTAGPGIQRYSTEYALQKLSLDPKKDVELRVFNTTMDAFAATKAGIIQAIAVFPPDDVASEKAGFNLLYNVQKDHVLYPTSCMYATNKYIKEHSDVILAYIRALSEGLAIYKTDNEFTMTTFLKWTKTDDREVAKSGIDVFARDMPSIPKWWPEPMKVILDALSVQIDKAKTTDPASLYDNSFIEQLEKEGFYDQLAKQYPLKK